MGPAGGLRDPAIRRRKLAQPELLALIQQTYRVLLTRGMRGTFLYSTDWEPQQMLGRLVAPARPGAAPGTAAR